MDSPQNLLLKNPQKMYISPLVLKAVPARRISSKKIADCHNPLSPQATRIHVGLENLFIEEEIRELQGELQRLEQSLHAYSSRSASAEATCSQQLEPCSSSRGEGNKGSSWNNWGGSGGSRPPPGPSVPTVKARGGLKAAAKEESAQRLPSSWKAGVAPPSKSSGRASHQRPAVGRSAPSAEDKEATAQARRLNKALPPSRFPDHQPVHSLRQKKEERTESFEEVGTAKIAPEPPAPKQFQQTRQNETYTLRPLTKVSERRLPSRMHNDTKTVTSKTHPASCQENVKATPLEIYPHMKGSHSNVQDISQPALQKSTARVEEMTRIPPRELNPDRPSNGGEAYERIKGVTTTEQSPRDVQEPYKNSASQEGNPIRSSKHKKSESPSNKNFLVPKQTDINHPYPHFNDSSRLKRLESCPQRHSNENLRRMFKIHPNDTSSGGVMRQEISRGVPWEPPLHYSKHRDSEKISKKSLFGAKIADLDRPSGHAQENSRQSLDSSFQNPLNGNLQDSMCFISQQNKSLNGNVQDISKGIYRDSHQHQSLRQKSSEALPKSQFTAPNFGADSQNCWSSEDELTKKFDEDTMMYLAQLEKRQPRVHQKRGGKQNGSAKRSASINYGQGGGNHLAGPFDQLTQMKNTVGKTSVHSHPSTSVPSLKLERLLHTRNFSEYNLQEEENTQIKGLHNCGMTGPFHVPSQLQCLSPLKNVSSSHDKLDCI